MIFDDEGGSWPLSGNVFGHRWTTQGSRHKGQPTNTLKRCLNKERGLG